jgi:hypothetical protein
VTGSQDKKINIEGLKTIINLFGFGLSFAKMELVLPFHSDTLIGNHSEERRIS